MRIYGKDIDIQSNDANANISLSFGRANMFSFGFSVPRCNVHAPAITPMGDYCCKYPAQIAGGIGLPSVNVCVSAITESAVNFRIESAGNGDVPIYEIFADAIVCGCCRPVTPAVTDALKELGMEVNAVAQYTSCGDCITGGFATCCFYSEPIGYHYTEWYGGELIDIQKSLCRPCFGIVCDFDYSQCGWGGDYPFGNDGCRCCASDWSQPKAPAQLMDVNDYTFAWKWNNFVECASCWWECHCGVPITGAPMLDEDVVIVMPNTREAYLCAPWSMSEWSGGTCNALCLCRYNWCRAPITFCLDGNPTCVCSGGARMNCGADFEIENNKGWRVWYRYHDYQKAYCSGGDVCCCRYGYVEILFDECMPKGCCIAACLTDALSAEFYDAVYNDGTFINNCCFDGCIIRQCAHGTCYTFESIYSPSVPLYCECISFIRVNLSCGIDWWGVYDYPACLGYVNTDCIGCHCSSMFSFGGGVTFCTSWYCRFCESVHADGGWTTHQGQEDSMCYGCVCLPWIGNFFGCGIIDTIRRVSETYGCYINGNNIYSPKSDVLNINCEVGYCVYSCDIYQCGYYTEVDPRFISCNLGCEGVEPMLAQLVSCETGLERYCGLPMYDPMHAPDVSGFCGYQYARFCGIANTPCLSVYYGIHWHALMQDYCQSCYDTGSPVSCDALANGCRYLDDMCCRTEVALGRYIKYADNKCAMYHPVGCADYGRGFALIGLNYPICGYIDTNACYCCEGVSIPWTRFAYDIEQGCQADAPDGCCYEIPLYRMLCSPSKEVRLNAVTLTTQPSDTSRIISAGVGSCFTWHGARYRIEKIDNYNPSAATCLKVFGIMV